MKLTSRLHEANYQRLPRYLLGVAILRDITYATRRSILVILVITEVGAIAHPALYEISSLTI